MRTGGADGCVCWSARLFVRLFRRCWCGGGRVVLMSLRDSGWFVVVLRLSASCSPRSTWPVLSIDFERILSQSLDQQAGDVEARIDFWSISGLKSTRTRISKTEARDHFLFFAEKGFNSLTQYNLVHIPIRTLRAPKCRVRSGCAQRVRKYRRHCQHGKSKVEVVLDVVFLRKISTWRSISVSSKCKGGTVRKHVLRNWMWEGTNLGMLFRLRAPSAMSVVVWTTESGCEKAELGVYVAKIRETCRSREVYVVFWSSAFFRTQSVRFGKQ